MSGSDDTIFVELWYPRSREIKHVEIDLVDVRASDGIRVTYDFDRDGWSVQQPTRLSWPAEDKVCDPGWKEVAFVRSWQLDAEQAANRP